MAGVTSPRTARWQLAEEGKCRSAREDGNALGVISLLSFTSSLAAQRHFPLRRACRRVFRRLQASNEDVHVWPAAPHAPGLYGHGCCD
eukprot:5497602-Pleurochrysis_carterae.AAC.1